MKCPWCGSTNVEADWVDIGVGSEQAGPYMCHNCQSTQLYEEDYKEASQEEKEKGWWQGRYVDEALKERNKNNMLILAISDDHSFRKDREIEVHRIQFPFEVEAGYWRDEHFFGSEALNLPPVRVQRDEEQHITGVIFVCENVDHLSRAFEYLDEWSELSPFGWKIVEEDKISKSKSYSG